MRLGGFRIIILPGNGLVKVKKLKVLKKFPKKSGINLDMSFNYFCHLKLTCLFLKPSKGHVYTVLPRLKPHGGISETGLRGPKY